MTGIRSLLAATDFSEGAERALRRAARLAAETGARLELLHVVSAPALADLRRLVPDAEAAKARVVAEARRTLDEAAARLHPGATARVEVGALPEAILAAARAHDLLVVGARGASALREAFLGTTADRLLLAAERPMLVVRCEPVAAYRRVIVPCEYAPPARRALELALRLAPGAGITLVHAYEAPYEATLWRSAVPEETIGRLRRDAEARTRAWLAGLRRAVGAPDAVDVATVHGSPRAAILGLLESQDADLVVMGKQGRSKAREMFLGSVTRQVLADAKCDVVVVPDAGP